jgi:hypothetical protein
MRSRRLHQKADGRGLRAVFNRTHLIAPRSFEGNSCAVLARHSGVIARARLQNRSVIYG